VRHLLQLLGRDPEAVELLTSAADHLESYLVLSQLAAIQSELRNHDEAWASLERASELALLKDKRLASSLAGERSSVAYHLGRDDEARELAGQSEEPFFKEIARRLEQPSPDARRVQLEVEFVRQHHMTCAPATLTAISRFWSMPADHLEVAEAICYDGTPGHSERHWAESHGWRAREFTVTWDSAVALIDAGIPFTLTTVDLQSAHLQAVIGYDGRRGTFIIRDPMARNAGEALADVFLERFQASGPRGMAMVPADRSDLLDRLDLPDADRFDRYHEIQRALVAHDREAASEAFEPLASEAPEHRLTLQARLSLAEYDADQTARMAAVDRLIELFPDEASFKLAKLAGLRVMGRREDRLGLLEGMIRAELVHPVIWQQYAQELGEDARCRTRVVSLLWRALRRDPQNGGTHYILANQLWAARRFEEALEAYRFATCLADKEEQFAQSWFTACRHFRRTEEALEFLIGRIKRHGAKTSLPARTLFQAYSLVNRAREGFRVLDEALALRPDDGELLTFAAEMNARFGKIEAARGLLERAEPQSARAAWLRAAADVAGIEGDRERALGLLEAVIAMEPLAVDAHANKARLLARPAPAGSAAGPTPRSSRSPAPGARPSTASPCMPTPACRAGIATRSSDWAATSAARRSPPSGSATTPGAASPTGSANPGTTARTPSTSTRSRFSSAWPRSFPHRARTSSPTTASSPPTTPCAPPSLARPARPRTPSPATGADPEGSAATSTRPTDRIEPRGRSDSPGCSSLMS